MTENTLLLRQIHPVWIQEGRVTSLAFKPTKKDNRRLSVHDGDQISAEAAWEYHTDHLAFASAGVMGISVNECQFLSLPVVPDPANHPAHVLVRFDGCSSSQVDSRAKALRTAAVSRGWQYRAESPA